MIFLNITARIIDADNVAHKQPKRQFDHPKLLPAKIDHRWSAFECIRWLCAALIAHAKQPLRTHELLCLAYLSICLFLIQDHNEPEG